MLKGLQLEDAMTGAESDGAYSVEKADATQGIPNWSVVQRRIGSGWGQRPVGLPLPGWRWHAEKRIWIGPHDAGRDDLPPL